MCIRDRLIPIVPTGLSEQPLERGSAILANQVLGEELPGMLYQPEHSRVVHWDLPLDSLLERQHQ
eukprot:10935573-Alexandrium_andersonii.AAC.1